MKISILSEEDRRRITDYFLSAQAASFKEFASSMKVQGLAMHEDDGAFSVSTSDQSAFEREYGGPGGQPEGWVMRAVQDSGGSIV